MIKQLTAAQFVAKLMMAKKDGALCWNAAYDGFKFTESSPNGPVRYIAPTSNDMSVAGYIVFVQHVDNLWRMKTGHGISDSETLKRLTVEEALDKIKRSDKNSIVSDRTAQLQIAVWNDGVEENYLAPDPVATNFVSYMNFLSKMKDLGCFGDTNFIDQYLKDRLRS